MRGRSGSLCSDYCDGDFPYRITGLFPGRGHAGGIREPVVVSFLSFSLGRLGHDLE